MWGNAEHFLKARHWHLPRACGHMEQLQDLEVRKVPKRRIGWNKSYLPLRLRLLMAEALGTERVPLLTCSMTHRSSSSSLPSCDQRSTWHQNGALVYTYISQTPGRDRWL